MSAHPSIGQQRNSLSRLGGSAQSLALVCGLLLLAVATGCRSDPQAIKRRSLDRADHYAQQHKTAEAVIEYRNAVQADPGDGESRLQLANALLKNGQRTEAVLEHVRAADLLITRPDVQLRAGNLLLLAGRFDDAKVRAEKALMAAPQNVDAQILLANALAGLKDIEGAIAEIEEAIKLEPDRGTAYTSLGTFEAGRGRMEAAESAFLRATELDPRAVSPRLALANFYWTGRRWPEVHEALEKALALEPNNLLAHRAMASWGLAVNRLEITEQHLKRIVELSESPEAAFALADFYTARDEQSPAREILQALTSSARSATPARIRLAALDHAAGRHSQAYASLDDVLREDGDNVQALLVRAAMLLADGRSEDAFVSANRATELRAESPAAFFTLARVQTARRRPDEAIAAYRQVLRLNPRAVGAQLALSRLHLASGQTTQAVDLAEDALRTDPSNPNARLTLVSGLLVQGELRRADVEISALSKAYPDSAPIEAKRGVLLGLQRDPAGARRAFQNALRLQPGLLEATAGLVALDMAQKDTGAALSRVDALISSPDADPAALMLAARTYAGSGNLRTAEELLRRLVQNSPEYLPAYSALGGLYVRQNRLDEALAEFEDLARRDAKPIAALTLAGIILEAKGRTPEARVRYERAVQIDPSAPVASNNLAWIYAQGGGNLDVALQLARAASLRLPDSTEVADTLGFIYYKKDLVPQAIQTLRRAVARDPDNAVYQYHLGLAFAKAGDKGAASRHLKRAIALNAEFDGVAEAKALLNELAAS